MIIYLHDEANDLATLSCREIVQRIIELVNDLTVVCRPRTIIISQHTAFPANEHLNQMSYFMNECILKYYACPLSQSQDTSVIMWQHSIGIFGPQWDRVVPRRSASE